MTERRTQLIYSDTNLRLHACPFDTIDNYVKQQSNLLAGFCRKMFYHGYDNYMKHAFPLDELNPLHCNGRYCTHVTGRVYIFFIVLTS